MNAKRLLVHFFVILLAIALKSCIDSVNLFEKDGKLLGILPLLEGKVVYKARVQTPELPKEEVFRRARRWCVLAYRSSKDVLQLVDKETGEIIGKGNSTIYVVKPGALTPQKYLLDHTISIDVSEDAYDITITGLALTGTTPAGLTIVSSLSTPVELFKYGTLKSIMAVFHAVDAETLNAMQNLQQFIKSPKP